MEGFGVCDGSMRMAEDIPFQKKWIERSDVPLLCAQIALPLLMVPEYMWLYWVETLQIYSPPQRERL